MANRFLLMWYRQHGWKHLPESPDRHAEELARRWLARVAKEHGEEPEEPNEDTVQAIRELIHACRIAMEMRLAVVHIWSL